MTDHAPTLGNVEGTLIIVCLFSLACGLIPGCIKMKRPVLTMILICVPTSVVICSLLGGGEYIPAAIFASIISLGCSLYVCAVSGWGSFDGPKDPWGPIV